MISVVVVVVQVASSCCNQQGGYHDVWVRTRRRRSCCKVQCRCQPRECLQIFAQNATTTREMKKRANKMPHKNCTNWLQNYRYRKQNAEQANYAKVLWQEC